jgi:DNA-directed RNA polymerase specialized sigma24 family protein
MIRKIVAGYGLPAEQAEDVLNDATLIFLQKIESGAYQFEGNTPTTYCIEIAKRLALMATRRHKRRSEPLESLPETSDPDAEALLHRRELGEMVQLLLGQLGQPCDNVVKLYHIDGYSDEEVVRNQWTNYKTADSLKMKRSDCMKKLVQLAKVWKTSNSI